MLKQEEKMPSSEFYFSFVLCRSGKERYCEARGGFSASIEVDFLIWRLHLSIHRDHLCVCPLQEKILVVVFQIILIFKNAKGA